MKRIRYIAAVLMATVITAATVNYDVLAHSGRTDGAGGHNKTDDGTYHYHSGDDRTIEYSTPQNGSQVISQIPAEPTTSTLIPAPNTVNTDWLATQPDLVNYSGVIEYQPSDAPIVVDGVQLDVENAIIQCPYPDGYYDAYQLAPVLEALGFTDYEWAAESQELIVTSPDGVLSKLRIGDRYLTMGGEEIDCVYAPVLFEGHVYAPTYFIRHITGVPFVGGIKGDHAVYISWDVSPKRVEIAAIPASTPEPTAEPIPVTMVKPQTSSEQSQEPSLAPTAKPSTEPTAEPEGMPEPVQTETPQPKEEPPSEIFTIDENAAYKLTYKSARLVPTAYGISTDILIEIENVGDEPLYLGSADGEIEEANTGYFLDSIDLVDKTNYVVDPGKKGYYHDASSLYDIDELVDIKLVFRPKISVARYKDTFLDLVEVQQINNGFNTKGRVVNTTDGALSEIIIVEFLYFDKDGELLAITEDNVTDDIASGGKVGFDTMIRYSRQDAAYKDVAYHEERCYIFEMQF